MGRGIRFTTEFKRETVRLALSSGRPRAEIAEDLGVGLSSLTRWIGQFRDEEMPPEIKDDLQAELKLSRTRFPWTQNWLNRSVQGGPEHDR